MMEDIIIVTTHNSSVIDDKVGMVENRRNICKSIESNIEASIAIVAYNRLDATMLCVENILKNTKSVKYKLLLVVNESDYSDGIIDYYKSIDYKEKVIMLISSNLGAPFAYQQIMKYFEGKYFIHVPNDVIVTPNWLDNLIKCAESDHSIGMVNPCSSNVSNLQCVNLDYCNYEEMMVAAKKYNISDSSKWQERIRLITLGTLFTRECLSAIGYIFDIGFMHDFGDDDVSFRVRRAGYKAVLAGDTWIHHNHDVFNMENKDPEKFKISLETGRRNFKEKYYGVDAWDDVNNFIFPFIEGHIEATEKRKNINILGIDVKCGTPILDVKNLLRKQNITDTHLSAFTQKAKYVCDLNTICDNDVICDRIEYLHKYFSAHAFNYIVLGESINNYENPYALVREMYDLLCKNGILFISLKNTYNVFTLLKLLGYENESMDCTRIIDINTFYKTLNSSGMETHLINKENFQLNNEIIKIVSDILENFGADNKNYKTAVNKLLISDFWLKIIKN